jgi:hypothetical protein
MQRVAGQYVVKKFADTLLRDDPPAQQPEQGQPQQGYQQAPAPAGQVAGGELNGSMIYDDDGNRLGVARHVSEVSVYVVSHTAAEINRTLQQAIADPEMELRLATDGNGRVTGLIYVPSTARAAQNIRGTRLDDV